MALNVLIKMFFAKAVYSLFEKCNGFFFNWDRGIARETTALVYIVLNNQRHRHVCHKVLFYKFQCSVNVKQHFLTLLLHSQKHRN